jgi:hypothetical protein
VSAARLREGQASEALLDVLFEMLGDLRVPFTTLLFGQLGGEP